MAEIASTASHAMGMIFAYRPCAHEDYVKRLQKEMEQPWPTAFSSLCASIKEGRYAGTSTCFMDLTSRAPERLEEFLDRHKENGALS
jgi:NAD(P)H dehydrogenase (quinone)